MVPREGHPHRRSLLRRHPLRHRSGAEASLRVGLRGPARLPASGGGNLRKG